MAAGLLAFVALWTAPADAGDAPLPVRELGAAIRSSVPGPDTVAFLGVTVDTTPSGLRVLSVVSRSPAEDAGLRTGDYLRSLGGTDLVAGTDLDRALAGHRPGDAVRLVAWRGGANVVASARLGPGPVHDTLFHDPVFRLAVVPLVFSDDRETPADPAALTKMLFTETGRTGAGASLADYYREESFGRLQVTGEILEPLRLRAPRSRYSGRAMGAAEGSAFQDASDLLLARLGQRGLERFNGVAFLYSGPAETRAGFAFWPHRSTVSFGARRIPYYVHCTSASDGLSIGVHCHEFGHLLGLGDAYGAGHRTGCGDFCVMSIGHRGGPLHGDDSPFSMCAECKRRLGWIDPVVVDPSTPQRLRLHPVGEGRDQVVIVPLDARCDEFLLLEVRARRGFDTELPSEGMFVWRIGGAPTSGSAVYAQGVDLVEAHGIDVFDASLVRIDEIAFPTKRCRDLTPDTKPALAPSRAGTSAYVTDIVRESDGSVVFTLGVPKPVRQAAPLPLAMERPDAEGFVVRRDPITGEDARFYVGPGDGAPASAAAAATGQERR